MPGPSLRRAAFSALALTVLLVSYGHVAAGSPPSVVEDINPAGSSAPRFLTNVGGRLFFSADDGTHGRELWKSNGTVLGTNLVLDMKPGASSSQPNELTKVGPGTLFFTATDGVHGRELWKSDGTAAGTMLVKDISSGVGGSNPLELTDLNGTLFFTARDGKGRELWKSDGTAAGTVRVKNVRPGSESSAPRDLTAADDVVFFSADDGSNGRELWISDGTAAGTHIAGFDLTPSGGTDPGWLVHVEAGRTVDFRSFTNDQIYRYDDALGGSYTTVTLPNEAIAAHHLINVNGRLFFWANTGSRDAIWTSDGEVSSTWYMELGDFFGDFTPPVAIGSKVYFAISDGTHPHALWVSNGTEAGTRQVDGSDPEQSYPSDLTKVGTRLFFVAIDACTDTCSGDEALWTSDGTDAGTVEVGGSAAGLPRELTNVGGTLYFSAYDESADHELWRFIP